MTIFELKDSEIAVILNALYSRYNDLEIASRNAKNPLLIESLKSELNELKSVIGKFEN